MKILLAGSDRDLLESLRRLLAAEDHETGCVTDGAQLQEQLDRERPDLVIADDHIPLLNETPALLCRRQEIPLILLVRRLPDAGGLCGKALPSVYLAYPFRPRQLLEAVMTVETLLSQKKAEHYGSAVLEPSRFSLSGRAVTAAEILLLRAAAKEGREAPGDPERTRLALNRKLSALQAGVFAAWVPEKGVCLIHGSYES